MDAAADGLLIESDNNTIECNFIGLQTNASPLGNAENGIEIAGGDNNQLFRNWLRYNGTHGLLLDSDGNSVEENVIGNNGEDGIAILPTGVSNPLVGNSFLLNGGYAIDLNDDDIVEGSDTGDGDGGANGSMNRATIQTANPIDHTIKIHFIGPDSAPHIVEFYRSESCDPSGSGEGLVSLGSFPYSTDGNGTFVGEFVVPGFDGTDVLTALVSDVDAGGEPLNTSEFSDCEEFSGLYLGLYVLLEGPWNGSEMNTSLTDDLPTSQPFSGPPWNYGGTETSTPQFFAEYEIVDWVLVQLRDGPLPSSTVVAEKAAMVSSGGNVLPAGTAPLKFVGVTPGSYYVVVYHRNHAAAMSASPIDFSDAVGSHDFLETGAGYTTGPPALKDLGNGFWGLFAGDGDPDGNVQALDFDTYIAQTLAGASGYQSGDYNMDGSVQALDFNIYIANTLSGASSQVP
jgi:hypothetical protein